MKKIDRTIKVAFADFSLKKAFEKLQSRRFEDRQLFDSLTQAIDDLRDNPLLGARIPSRL